MTHRLKRRYRRIIGESSIDKETSDGTVVTLRYHELECGHKVLIRAPSSISEAISHGFREKRSCRSCAFEQVRRTQ